ncbi:MAG TPA: hypothetical protein VKU36_05325 [Candidatus Babeliales bacterium]|nr:hypothetical protein [Candidatus Babeliales bacterium]
MKSLKNITCSLLLTIATLSTSYTLSAPVMEIYNKQKGGSDFVRFIITDLDTGKTVASPYVGRGKGKQWQSPEGSIDPNHELQFEVWTDPKAAKQTFVVNASGKKTIYLSWNPEESVPLYPQTGPLMGFLGKTESGLPLDKKVNVSRDEIQFASPSTSMTQPTPVIIQSTQKQTRALPSIPSQPQTTQTTQSSPASTRALPQTPQSSSTSDLEIVNKLNRQIIIGFSQKSKNSTQEFVNPNITFDETVSSQEPISISIFDVQRDLLGSGEQATTYSGSEYEFVINPAGKKTVYMEVISSGSLVSLRPKSNVSSTEKASNIEQNQIQSKGSTKVTKTEFIAGSFRF